MPRDMLARSLPAEVVERLGLDRDELIEAGVAARSRGALVEGCRRAPVMGVEVRGDADGPVGLAGYAATFDVDYEVAGGPPVGFRESIAPGAFTKALREQHDVRFLVNHDGVPLARTASGTLRLTQDDIGLLVEVDDLDTSNPTAAELVSAIRRGDLDQMSFAFVATRQEWNDDWTERRIIEVRLFDVSAVTFPANDVTTIAVRDDNTDDANEQTADPAGGPLRLRRAQVEMLRS